MLIGRAIEEIARAQGVITAEPVGIAMQAIRPTARDYIDDGSCIPSVFRTKGIRDNTEFLS